ncbi:MAG: hypothetical protein OXP66_19320 [Candidatus Tectomicrobia bacterium]|nr:hypothetical protein [Candidatus Tectomicrobia bacterium]
MKIGIGKHCFVVAAAMVATLSGPHAQGQTAQSPKEPFLDFRDFSGIRDAEDLGFLDYVKWSGMILVNAPALKNIVAVYGYAEHEIEEPENENCFDRELGNFHVLSVDERLPVEQVISSLESKVEILRESIISAGMERAHEDTKNADGKLDVDGIVVLPNVWRRETELSEELNSFKELLGQADWITPVMINAVLDDSDLANLKAIGGDFDDVEAIRVWNEIEVSNLCDLATQLPNIRESFEVSWTPVAEHKLQSVIEGVAASAQESQFVFFSDYHFPGSNPVKKYFAECAVSEVMSHPESTPSLCTVQ